MRWIILGLFLLLISPVRIGAALRWSGQLPTLVIGVMIWGVRVQTSIHAERDPAGTLLLTAALGKRPLHFGGKNADGSLQALAALFRSGSGRTALHGVVQVRKVELYLQIGGENAAFAALFTGLLRALNPLFPHAAIHCHPSFNGQTKVYARCIAETRLGILLAAWLRRRRRHGQKEEAAWSIPSET